MLINVFNAFLKGQNNTGYPHSINAVPTKKDIVFSVPYLSSEKLSYSHAKPLGAVAYVIRLTACNTPPNPIPGSFSSNRFDKAPLNIGTFKYVKLENIPNKNPTQI